MYHDSAYFGAERDVREVGIPHRLRKSLQKPSADGGAERVEPKEIKSALLR